MKYKKEVFRCFALISQLGISVMVPVFLCVFAGIMLDNHFGTSLTVWLLFLGIMAGGRNAYILAKSVIHENGRSKGEEQ